MPVREHVTQQTVKLALNEAITTVTTTEGAIFDASRYNLGIYFAIEGNFPASIELIGSQLSTSEISASCIWLSKG